MKLIGAALCGFLLCACSTTPELTVIVGPSVSEGRNEIGAHAMLIQRFGKHGVWGYSHHSELFNGKPFSDDEEISGDLAGVGFRFGGRDRP